MALFQTPSVSDAVTLDGKVFQTPSVSDAVTLDGKVFQTRGAATKNARSPIIVRHEDGVTRADVDEDRSLFLVYPRPPDFI